MNRITVLILIGKMQYAVSNSFGDVPNLGPWLMLRSWMFICILSSGPGLAGLYLTHDAWSELRD